MYGTTVLRGRAERAGDRSEDLVDRSARRTNRTDCDERDERDQQCVLEQVLTFFVTTERLHKSNKLRHLIPFDVHAFRPCGVDAAELRGRAERAGDRGEDAVDRSARGTHSTDRDKGDERDEQCVLEQVLALFVACE